MNRHDFFAAVLPIISNYIRRDEENDDWPTFELGIVGPTADEVAYFAPEIAAYRAVKTSGSGPTVVGVTDGDDLTAIVDSVNAGRMSRDGFTCTLVVVIPPETKVDASGIVQKYSRKHPGFREANVSLLLATVLHPNWNYLLIAADDDALSGQRSAALRSHLLDWMVRSVWGSLTAHSYGWHEDVAKAQGSTQGLRTDADALHGWMPRTIWRISLRSGDSEPAINFVQGELSLFTSLIHVRQFDQHATRQLQSNEVFVRDALAVASGSRPRTEDDRFLPVWELRRSNNWSPSRGEVEVRGLALVAERMGYPTKRVGDVCDVHVVTKWRKTRRSKKKCVDENVSKRFYLWLTGPHAGSCMRSLPSFQKGQRIAVLEADDAEYVLRCFRDAKLQDEIRCRSFGSVREPRISEGLIRDLSIPWPSKQERQRLLAKLGELTGTAERISESIKQMESVGSSVLEFLETEAPPWTSETVFTPVNDAMQDVGEELPSGTIAKLRANSSHRVDDLPNTIPGPIALLVARHTNEVDSYRQCCLLTDIAEAATKYASLVQLALLLALDQTRGIEVMPPKAMERSTPDFAFGDWRLLCGATRRAIEHQMNVMPDIDYNIHQFAAIVCATNLGRLEASIGKVLEWRNADGHATLADERRFEEMRPILQSHVEIIRCELGWIERFMPFYLESVTRKRHATQILRRCLVRAEKEYARQTLTRGSESKYGGYPTEEVYLEYGDADTCLPLYPWIVYGRLDQSRSVASVWMLDGWTPERVKYRSTDIGGERAVQIAEPRQRLRELLAI